MINLISSWVLQLHQMKILFEISNTLNQIVNRTVLFWQENLSFVAKYFQESLSETSLVLTSSVSTYLLKIDSNSLLVFHLSKVIVSFSKTYYMIKLPSTLRNFEEIYVKTWINSTSEQCTLSLQTYLLLPVSPFLAIFKNLASEKL